MYDLLECSLADTRRLFEYRQKSQLTTDFGLKSFAYGWLASVRQWQAGEKVLDVGGAYSPFPVFLQTTYGCDAWVVDDFGTKSNEPYWLRGRSPEVHVHKHPEVNYVLERVGDPSNSTLPESYFGVIYSVSTLEHVPGILTSKIWQHMDRLLKPGGEMWHQVDFPFPSNGGVKKMVKAWLFDTFPWVFPQTLKLAHLLVTPQTYLRLLLSSLPFSPDGRKALIGKLRLLHVVPLVLNPEVLVESYEHGYFRIIRDKLLHYTFERWGGLLIGLRKENNA